MNKTALVLKVLERFPADTAASVIADAVWQQHGISLSPAYVRTVRSRAARGEVSSSSPSVSTRAAPAAARAPGPRAAAIAVAPKPAPVVPRPARELAEPELDQGDQQVIAQINSVVKAVERALSGKPQQIVGSVELIGHITEICNDPELREEFPGFEIDTFFVPNGMKALVIRSADLPLSDPVMAKSVIPSVPVDIPRPRAARKRRQEPVCEFCDGKRLGVPGANLYRCSGGPLGPRLRILCGLHAAPEAAAGADVKPYRVQVGEQFSAGLVGTRKTPYMQQLTELAKSVGSVLLGSEAEGEDSYPT